MRKNIKTRKTRMSISDLQLLIENQQKLINDQKDLIEKLMKKLDKETKEEYTKEFFREHFKKHMRFIKAVTLMDNCGYYCPMSLPMFLGLIDLLILTYNIHPEYRDKTLGGLFRYSDGLMFTCLDSLKNTDELLKRLFDFEYTFSEKN